jgi:hypothetical protein
LHSAEAIVSVWRGGLKVMDGGGFAASLDEFSKAWAIYITRCGQEQKQKHRPVRASSGFATPPSPPSAHENARQIHRNRRELTATAQPREREREREREPQADWKGIGFGSLLKWIPIQPVLGGENSCFEPLVKRSTLQVFVLIERPRDDHIYLIQSKCWCFNSKITI